MKKQFLKQKKGDKYEIEIIDYCERLKERLLSKYRKGKKEHGGEPVAINCQKEINMEILDILNYHLIHEVNNG